MKTENMSRGDLGIEDHVWRLKGVALLAECIGAHSEAAGHDEFKDMMDVIGDLIHGVAVEIDRISDNLFERARNV